MKVFNCGKDSCKSNKKAVRSCSCAKIRNQLIICDDVLEKANELFSQNCSLEKDMHLKIHPQKFQKIHYQILLPQEINSQNCSLKEYILKIAPSKTTFPKLLFQYSSP